MADIAGPRSGDFAPQRCVRYLVWHLSRFGFSGGTAVWIAEYLGFEQIYICGCDNYMTSRRYWHSKNGDLRVEDGVSNIQAWVKVRDYMKEPEKVRVASGCLTKVFQGL